MSTMNVVGEVLVTSTVTIGLVPVTGALANVMVLCDQFEVEAPKTPNSIDFSGKPESSCALNWSACGVDRG